MNKYGYFTEDGLEFVVTDPVTPRPWINYLTNEKYCAIISQAAGGYSFYKDCRTDRILRWAPENWQKDRPGRYVYMRDESNGKYWSATYQPVRKKPQFFEARHGLGYTTITSHYEKIRTTSTYFVPTHDECELWLISVENTSQKDRTLTVYPYIEWSLGDYHEELRYRNIMTLYNRIWYDESHKAIFAKKTAFWQGMAIQPYKGLDFFGTSLPVKGYATQKYPFLGRMNTEENPVMITEGAFKNTAECSGEDAIGCMKHTIKLKPGAKKEFVVILGQADTLPRVTKLLTKYRVVSTVKKELKTVQALWQDRLCNNIVVETPDKSFDTLVNTWVKYQLYICNFWSRSPSYYHEGGGGRGYRDSCQDGEAIVSINPDLTKKKIFTLAALIRKDGTSAPGWSDTKGPAGHRPNKDHPVWLTVTVASYIKETGDKDILFEYVPYLKDKWIRGWDTDADWCGGSATDGEGTLFEHLERNLEFTFNDVGPKGFPLIGHADWNDAIDAAGIKLKGESVWLAMALVRSLKILSELAIVFGEDIKAQELLRKAETMTHRINESGWDGNWYVRGFTDDGSAYGVAKNKAGKIFLNTQSWAILADVVPKDRLKKLLKNVDKYLNGKEGLALFYPAYSTWDQKLGRISMFSEGTKENAAVFCHATTFMTTAYALIGEGTKAYEGMRKIMPNAQANYDLYKTEPYCFAEYKVGPEHPYLYGEGAFTWITGTAGWNFMLATEYILGAQRSYEGLVINPCIPRAWKKCSIRRPFRGAVYMIRIENPDGVESGVREIYLDGKKMKGTLIRPFHDGKTHDVRVVMGEL